ncbi:NAD(P)/FAD-dependent oxidoreductase [Rivibacter subsaxonicus]|nr:NAD(P)/FAD-dependent oxidoreductase [Rivibacter subsaxonicus]
MSSRLGLERPITRRDFLNGVALGSAALAPSTGLATDGGGEFLGQTDAAFRTLHQWRNPHQRVELPAHRPGDEEVELVVVGAGISGLAAAVLWRQQRPGARVLLIDPQADIGGHALRNEFVSASGRRIIGYGGSEALDSPSFWSPATHRLIRDIGIDLAKFHDWYDKQWGERHGVEARGIFFHREQWGEDRLVRPPPGARAAQWVPQTPLNPRAQADLIRLIDAPRDWLAGRTRSQKRTLLAGISYDRFITRHCRVDPELTRYFNSRTRGWFGVGTDATSALDGFAMGLPGFAAMNLGKAVDPRMSPTGRQAFAGSDEYIYHFPDGNAGVVRAMLRKLIPAALPGTDIESLVLAERDDRQLDAPGAPVRMRLNSSVVRVAHVDGARRAVDVGYIGADGQARTVRAGQVVLACWSRVIPLLCPELPAPQATALDDQHKVPLVYANVLLSNWRALQAAGLHGFRMPGRFFDEGGIDFPVSIGSYRFAQTPDDPVLLHFSAVVGGPQQGIPAREQAAAGRRQLTSTSFETLETELRDVLQRALGPHGFFAARDIEAITLNRWSHGYAYEYMRPWDRYWPAGPLPITAARRGLGRIAIANSDAGAFAYAQGAIDQATRAVAELLPQARLPAWLTVPGPSRKKLGLA